MRDSSAMMAENVHCEHEARRDKGHRDSEGSWMSLQAAALSCEGCVLEASDEL